MDRSLLSHHTALPANLCGRAGKEKEQPQGTEISTPQKSLREEEGGRKSVCTGGGVGGRGEGRKEKNPVVGELRSQDRGVTLSVLTVDELRGQVGDSAR